MKKMMYLPEKVRSVNESLKKQSTRLTTLLIIGITITLSGCSFLNIGNGAYSCSGVPDGVQCMSARDVYTATNDGNFARPTKPEGIKATTGAGNTDSSNLLLKPFDTNDAVIDNYVAPHLPDRPIPMRTPAQVMRIWVAPWEDTNGDLIISGYLYTEIEPRRWVIGDSAPQGKFVLKPLQIVKHKPKSNPTK